MGLEEIFSGILFLPLVSALLIALFFRKSGSMASYVSVVTALVIAGLTFLFLWEWDGTSFYKAYEWLKLGSLSVSMGFFVDYKAALMLFVVTFVGFWIHMFSLGYMQSDKSKARFFGGLSIFMFSMLGIVFSSNLVMIFIFWELVGFSSYMLIAHYFHTSEASNAAKKAFIVNRVGDVGLLIGIIWTYWSFGTVDLIALEDASSGAANVTKFALSALLMCGFIGKSAQFPLHVWLPDAMAGPTPVSALIHAATMVAAGVYFLCRINFLFVEETRLIVMWLGAVMTAYAGFAALTQGDIKKILAYSTLSQLGYMATAFGMGYPGLALFHLTTHAFFNALLFLGAGSVIHACHHEQDIFKMGGLLKKMPVTGFTFLIGLLALCGVNFLSGFFSKDAIIEAAYLGNTAVYGLLLFSALLTAVYSGRLFFIAFLGSTRSKNAEHAKENGLVMLLPLVVLCALAIVGGYVSLWPSELSMPFVGELTNLHHTLEAGNVSQKLLMIAVGIWSIGLMLSLLIYKPNSKSDALEKKSPRVFAFLSSKLWFDEIYTYYVKHIQDRFAFVLSFLDSVLLNGIIIRGTGGLFGFVGLLTRGTYTGSVRTYAYWFVLGSVLLFLILTYIFS